MHKSYPISIATVAMAILFVFGGFAAVVVFNAIDIATQQPWFEATVTVPDHRVGDDPKVVYTRTIRNDMTGSWTVEIQVSSNLGWARVCDGRGNNAYTIDETKMLPLTLSQFAGVTCALAPGRYRLSTTWEMAERDQGGAVRRFYAISNEFVVSR